MSFITQPLIQSRGKLEYCISQAEYGRRHGTSLSPIQVGALIIFFNVMCSCCMCFQLVFTISPTVQKYTIRSIGISEIHHCVCVCSATDLHPVQGISLPGDLWSTLSRIDDSKMDGWHLILFRINMLNDLGLTKIQPVRHHVLFGAFFQILKPKSQSSHY